MCFCSETLVSSRRHISDLMVPGFDRPMQLLRGEVDRLRGLTVYVRDDFSAYRQRSYECGWCDVIVFKICSSSHNFYVLGVYRNPDLSNNFFYCLQAAMAKVQSVDKKGSFLFVGHSSSRGAAWVFHNELTR